MYYGRNIVVCNMSRILSCVVVAVLLIGAGERAIATERGAVRDAFVEGYLSGIEGQKDVLKTRIVAVFMIIETLPTVEQDAAIEDLVQRIMSHSRMVIQEAYLEGLTTGYEEAVADYQPENIKGLVADAYMEHQRHLGRIVDPYDIKILEAQDMGAFRSYVAEYVVAANNVDQVVGHVSIAFVKKLKAAFRRFQIVPTSQRDVVVEGALKDFLQFGLGAYYRGQQDPFVKRVRTKLKSLTERQQ